MSSAMTAGAETRLAVRLPVLLLSWSLWLAALAVAGRQTLQSAFDFDAADPAGWLALWSRFDQGGALAFDFVASIASLPLVALVGMLAILLRLSEIAERMVFLRLYLPDIALPLPRPGEKRIETGRFLSTGRRREPSMTGRDPASLPLASGPGSSRSELPLPAIPDRPAAPVQEAPPPAVIPSLPAALPVGVPPEVIPLSAADRAAPATGPSDPPLPDPSPPVPERRALPPEAAVERLLALAEICTDPLQAWMEAALAEEIAVFPAAAWQTIAEMGETGRWLSARLDRAGLLPAAGRLPDGPATRPVDELMFYEEAAAPILPPRPATAGAVLSLRAACLCELVESHLCLAAWDAAGDPAWNWLAPEIRGRLAAAMAAMREEDWASLDRDPETARRMRLLTDRLREELRGEADRGFPSRLAEPRAAEALELAPSSAVGPSEVVAAVLAEAGFRLLAPPPAGGVSGYLLAQRGGEAVLVRLFGLRGRCWRFGSDSLAPWEADGGAVMPSPCRELWQRLLVMRSLHRELHLSGLLICHDGHFADAALAARLVAADRGRTAVSLVALGPAPAGCADLAGWAAAFAPAD